MPFWGIVANDVKMTSLVAPSPNKVQRPASCGKVFFRGHGDAIAAGFWQSNSLDAQSPGTAAAISPAAGFVIRTGFVDRVALLHASWVARLDKVAPRDE